MRKTPFSRFSFPAGEECWNHNPHSNRKLINSYCYAYAHRRIKIERRKVVFRASGPKHYRAKQEIAESLSAIRITTKRGRCLLHEHDWSQLATNFRINRATKAGSDGE